MSHHQSLQARQRYKGKGIKYRCLFCARLGEGDWELRGESGHYPLTGCLLLQPLEGWFLGFFFNVLSISAAEGLSCGTQDLLVVASGLLVVACMWIVVPNQGSNPGPLHWEHRVLPTGPPGKSLEGWFLTKF